MKPFALLRLFTVPIFYISLFCGALLFMPSTVMAEMKEHPEVNEELRNVKALEVLQRESSAISIFVKGLCCPVCGIGVRRKLSRLSGVDRSRFKEGVDLDAKHQIATVALKEGELPSLSDLAQAVDDAGYIAVNLYTLENGKLKTTKFPVR
jgi:copper chaperone CopZ